MRRDWITGIILLIAAPLLIAGLAMPAISVTSLAVFEREYSLVDGVRAFFDSGDYFLFLLVGLFTILLPALKIAVGLFAWLVGPAHSWAPGVVRLFDRISRWSMLDVLVVAVTILVLEGSLVNRADVGLGIICFAGAVILSAIATHRLARRPPQDSFADGDP